MINRTHALPVVRQCQLLELAALDGLLPADAGVRDGSGADAPDRRAASAASVCRRADAARSLAARRPRDWAAARGAP